MLSENDKKNLLKIARETLEDKVCRNKEYLVDASQLPEVMLLKGSAFVSLHYRHNNKLRGCMGIFNSSGPLYKLIQEMVISAALRDYRFDPLKAEDTKGVEIEISVLTPLEKINSPEKIILGKHGIHIRKGHSSGTFLPQVAAEQDWDLEEFLGYCSKHKAGIGWEGWKDAELFVFKALVFSESNI